MSAELSYLTAEIYDTQTIILYWGASANTSYVNIEQSFNGKNFINVATNVINQPYKIEGLTSNFIYFFRVTPYTSSNVPGLPYITHIYVPYNTSIEKFHIGKVASNEIPLYWSGEFYSVFIEYKRSVDLTYQSVTVTGNNSYQITNLVPNTEYNFRLTPININGSKSDRIYSLVARTDIVSYIDSISLASINSTTAVVNWTGNADYIKLQVSTDGRIYTNAGTYNSHINTSGTTTIYGLFPQTKYFIRIIPYNSSLEIGKPSAFIIGTTYQGFSEFYASYIGTDNIVLNWNGSYNKATLFKSSDGGVTYDLLTQLDNSIKTLTDYNISPYEYYYYYLFVHDDVYNIDISSPTLTILSDFNSLIYANLNPVSANSLSLDINSTSRYLSLDVNISSDGGNRFFDLSNLTQNPQNGNYSYLINFDGEKSLTPNTNYTILLLPYSLYDHSPHILLNNYTLGNITYFDYSYNTIDSVVLSWQGTYSYVTLEYSTDADFSTITESITGITDNYYNLNVDAGVPYYYRIIPANNNGVNGPPIISSYFPVINSIYYSDVSYSSAVINWTGTYSSVTLQVSTGSDFYDVYTTETSYRLPIGTGDVVYSRIIPHNESKNGVISQSVYNPIITDLNVVSMNYETSQLSLYWKGVYNYANIKYYYVNENFSTSQTIDISSQMVGNTLLINNTYIPDARHTSYTFILTPYAYGYSDVYTKYDVSGAIYQITTPSIPNLYITNIEYLSSINSVKFNLNWGGKLTKIGIYYSTDGSKFSQIATIMNNLIQSYSYVTTNLYTSYYRVLPYYETVVGVSSDIIYIPSIIDLSLSNIRYTQGNEDIVEIDWKGAYENVTLQYSNDNSTFYDITNNFTMDKYIIDNNIISNLNFGLNVYYFRLIPYSNGMTNKNMNYLTQGLNSRTIYNALIKNIYISAVHENNIILNWVGVFDKVTIQASNDGVLFSNLNGGVYIDGNSLSILTKPHVTKYYKIIPYYSTSSGYIPCIQSPVTYIPSITNVYISDITISNINVLWSGIFNYVEFQYSTNNINFTSLDNNINNNINNNIFSVDSTYIQNFSPQYETYYFRTIPYSRVNSLTGDVNIVTGLYKITYNPTINYINIPYVSSSAITLQWSGTYNSVDIKTSTGNGVWDIMYRNIKTSSISVPTNGYTTKYYQIIPRNNSSPLNMGIGSDIIFIPSVTIISIYNIDLNSITLSWPADVVYTYANLQYSTDNINFADIKTNIPIGTYESTVTDSDINGLNTRTGVYYFRLIPYTYAFNSGTESNVIVGLPNVNSSYNPTITDAYVIPVSDSSTNSLFVYFSGQYSSAVIYYGMFGQPLFNIITFSDSSTGGYNYVKIENLQSNTTYSFNIYPVNIYNDYGYVYNTNGTTISLLDSLNFSYDVANSSFSSIGLKWLNNGYSSLQIYNALTSSLVYTSTNTYNYDSSGVEVLSKNSSYQYYAVVNDKISNQETTTNITAYTFSSPYDADVRYSIVDDYPDISFSWNNIGYKSISIYNYTLCENSPPIDAVKTFTLESGITSYTFTGSSYYYDNLLYNTKYLYKVTLVNDYDISYSYYVTTYSGSNATINISLDSTRYSKNTIPLDITGLPNAYSGFILYINDDETGTYTYGNTYVYGDTSMIINTTVEINMDISNSIVSKPNNQYSFKIAPFNQIGVLSNVGSPVSIKTLANITTFTTANYDTSSVVLYFDGSYEKVGIESATDSGFTQNYRTTRLSDIRATNYIYNGLMSNVKYYFRVTPINTPAIGVMEDISGIYVESSITTFAKLTYFKYTNLEDISSNGIGIEWEGTQSYVNVQFSTDMGATYDDLGYYTTKYKYFTNLLPNTKYYFRAVPYNSVDVSSNTYYYFSAATRGGFINNFYINSVIDNSAIQIYCDGYFDKMLLKSANYSNFTDIISNEYIDYSPTNLYVINNLDSDKLYYYRVYPVTTIIFEPYNQIDVCGNAFERDISAITYPSISYLTVQPTYYYDKPGIDITWNGSYTNMILYSSTTAGTYVSSIYTATSSDPKTYSISNLSYNTKYYFKAVPYSSTSNLTGKSIVDVNTATYPVISNKSISSIGRTNIVVNYTAAFTRLDINLYVTYGNNYVDSKTYSYYREPGSGISSGTTGTDISGLQPNMLYNIQYKAYNENGLENLGGLSGNFTTNP